MLRTLALLTVVVAVSCASAMNGIQGTSLRLEFDNGGICSGTAVAANVVLSADHCWDDHARLLFINGKSANALDIERDGNDHVLVRVNYRFTSWARMGPEPKQSDRVRWIGNPARLSSQYREGYVTGFSEGMTLVSADVFGGDSGAGVFDERGRVVGVVSAMQRWQTHSGHQLQLMVMFPLEFTDKQWRDIR